MRILRISTNYSILFLSLFCREEIWEKKNNFFLNKIVQFSFQLAKLMCPYWKNHYSICIYIQLHTDWKLHWDQWHFGIYWHLYRVILITEHPNKPLTGCCIFRRILFWFLSCSAAKNHKNGIRALQFLVDHIQVNI